MTNDSELAGLLVQVTKRGEGVLRKDDLYRAARKISDRLAEKNETPERAFTRIFTGPVGLPILKALKSSPGSPFIAKAQSGYEGRAAKPGTMGSGDADDGDGSTADDDDDGGPSFSSLVDSHQAAHPKMNRSASIDHVLSSREGRKSMTVEKRKRLARAMGG
jgi:hypothetical protein